MSTSERQQKINEQRLRGMISHRCIESLLLENGIQYDVEYTDHPGDLENLGRYKLLVLPFGYAISEDAVKAIKKAVDGGTRLLIFDRLAETNQYGVRHKEPLLKKLIGHKNVKYLEVNLAVNRKNAQVRAGNLKAIREMLGGTGYYFDKNNAKVEYLLRQVDPKNYILYLANWGANGTAAPVIGLPVPKGSYRLTVCSSDKDEVNGGLVDGKAKVTAGALERFDVQIPAGEVKLIRIQPED